MLSDKPDGEKVLRLPGSFIAAEAAAGSMGGMGLALLNAAGERTENPSRIVTVLIVIFVVLVVFLLLWQGLSYFNNSNSPQSSTASQQARQASRSPYNSRSPSPAVSRLQKQSPGQQRKSPPQPTPPQSQQQPSPPPQVVYSPGPRARRVSTTPGDDKFTVVLQSLQFSALSSHSSRDFAVKDKVGNALFHVTLMKPHPDMWEGDGQIPELLSVQTADQERELATCPIFPSQRECNVEDMNGVAFGKLVQQGSSGNAMIFTFRASSGDALMVQGDPMQHSLRVTKGSDIIAEGVPGSGPNYEVVCQTQSDIGLTSLLLLAIDRMVVMNR